MLDIDSNTAHHAPADPPDQAQRLRSRGSSRSFRVIAITSGKGGVGKTNIAVNLALSLGRDGRRVLLLDADLGLANADVLLGVQAKADLRHVLLEGRDLRDCLTPVGSGVDLLAGGSGIAELADLDSEHKWRLLEAIEPLGDRYDTLLIDTGAGIGSNVRFFAGAAQDVLVVVGPEPTSLTDAYSTIKVLSHKCGVRRVLVCVNRVTSLSAAREVFRQLTAVTSRFLPVVVELCGWVPNDPLVEQAVMKQVPFTTENPMGPASQAVRLLGESVLRRAPEGVTSTGFQIFWQTLLAADAGGHKGWDA